MANRETQEAQLSPQQIMSDVYTPYWKEVKGHGPEDARISLLRRIRPHLLNLGSSQWVLDLGAGRQILERQWNSWLEKPDCHVTTIDIADIRRGQLLRASSQRVHHARGDGANLPYQNARFALAVSSMGLELMPTEAIPELARVMQPGGRIFVNVLHPTISAWKKDHLTNVYTRKPSEKRARDFWEYYARPECVFAKGDANIQHVLTEFGFKVDRIETVFSSEGDSSWIEIDAIRTDTHYDNQGAEQFIRGIEQIDALGSQIFLE